MFDKTNIDAEHWANEYLLHATEGDKGLLLTYFANYRFAISDPLEATIEKLEEDLESCRSEFTTQQYRRDKYRATIEKLEAENASYEKREHSYIEQLKGEGS